jgi:hypothetical protein
VGLRGESKPWAAPTDDAPINVDRPERRGLIATDPLTVASAGGLVVVDVDALQLQGRTSGGRQAPRGENGAVPTSGSRPPQSEPRKLTWRSLSPWYVPVGSTPCSSEMTCACHEAVRGPGGTLGGDRDFNRPKPQPRAPVAFSEGPSGLTHLPELGTDLVTALATLDVNDLAHRTNHTPRKGGKLCHQTTSTDSTVIPWNPHLD